MSKILGIDLGTTNSCMAVMEGGEPVVLENSEGARTTPSVVAFTKSGERLVGEAAKRQAVTNSQNTVYSIKRFMGRKFQRVQDELKRVPYKVVEASNGDAHVEVEVSGERKRFSPPEISAMILAKLKTDAESDSARKSPRRSSPFPPISTIHSARRQRTPEESPVWKCSASSMSRLPLRLRTAWTRRRTKKSPCMTWAAARSIFPCWKSATASSRSKATNGDTHLGGDDWDNRIMDWILDEFKKDTGMDLRKQPDALQRIKEEAEKAKIALSSAQEYEINLPFITADASGPKHIQKKIDPREDGAAVRRSLRAHHQPGQELPEGRRH